MRYERIDNSLFTSNRKNYIKKVDSGSASVFISNDELPTNADELLPFVPVSYTHLRAHET